MNPQYVRMPVQQRGYVRDSFPVHIQYATPQVIHPGPPKKIESRAAKQVGGNFLPSIVNEAYHNVLEQVVTAICYTTGFDDIEASALETLTLILHRYIKRAGEQTRVACEAAGRTIATPSDVWFALVNMGMNVEQLPNFFAEQLERGTLTIHPPEILPPESKVQSLHVGIPRPHPAYVYEWMPPLPDPHTYIRTEVTNEPDITYEKVREAMSSQKRNAVTSLVNYMVRTYPSFCIFSSFQDIIHLQVSKIVEKESTERRLEESFVAFRDLLGSKDIDGNVNISELLYDKNLISKSELDSGLELACMCSDGTILDTYGQIVKIDDGVVIDLDEKDKVGSTKSRVHCLEAGAESLRYHWNMDEMLNEMIEIDSCSMDVASGSRPHVDEMRFLQDKFTFEYIPEWCNVLSPSYEMRSYLHFPWKELKAEEEAKKEGEVPKTEETEVVEEDDTVPDNLYFRKVSELEFMDAESEENDENGVEIENENGTGTVKMEVDEGVEVRN